MMGITWPDGKALLDQPVRLRLAFALISRVDAQVRKEAKP